MRRLIAVWLVACGGASTPAPKPIKPEPATPAPVDDLDNCSAHTAICVVEDFEALTEKACACHDKECADQVVEEVKRWEADAAKHQIDPREGDLLTVRMGDLDVRYLECMRRANGGADPCSE